MKILKKIGIAILVIIVLLLVIALILPKEYKVEREVVVNKPVAEVFDYARHLKNGDEYSVWNMGDMDKKQTFSGTDGEVGFINSWSGNDKVGVGEQEIKAIDVNKRMDVEVRFKEPFESVMQGYTLTESINPNTTKLIWGCKGESSYPWNIMNFMMDGMLGKDIQQNLDNMKAKIEQQ
ncbi:SRPBCC family protein [Flavobacterium sp. RHBU_3]|uniref:SRPBCC family protein n=1 Tax=Flavobacterium sp. RHBU_3 TaxID=3391184 RepID=UPI0039852870